MDLQTTTATRIEIKTNIGTLRLPGTQKYTHTNATKKTTHMNTHTHTHAQTHTKVKHINKTKQQQNKAKTPLNISES
jgi:hypothetical protein